MWKGSPVKLLFNRTPEHIFNLEGSSIPLDFPRDSFISEVELHILDQLSDLWFRDWYRWGCLFKPDKDSELCNLLDYILGYILEIGYDEADSEFYTFENTIVKDIEFLDDYWNGYFYRMARYYIDEFARLNRVVFPLEEDITAIEIQFNDIFNAYEVIVYVQS